MLKEIRVIDRGGFGVVHEVEQENGFRLARKSFDPQIGTPSERDKLQKRFVREVRIQSQIKHPNIMPIIQYDLEASPPWFTMPLATGSFSQKIEQDRNLSTLDPDPWQDILGAIEELHRLGYVHRDLKPANILLVDGRWVLSDFGLILPTARDTTVLTSSQSAYGSHYYAAPEQAWDFRNTPEQADIFALGCILHDVVEPLPIRVPFAQIRIAGIYGPTLEKCTETEPKNRFPNIAALRANLFDIWRTSQFPAPSADETSLLEAVTSDPLSTDAWRSLISHNEQLSPDERAPILRAIDEDLIVSLSTLDDVLFSRTIALICAWIKENSFAFVYCDIIGDRLIAAYRVATVRIQCQIVLSALELAVSHNRWHVMSQVGAMLSPTANDGLVDRLLIEMNLDENIERRLRRIEDEIDWERDRWHKKIAVFLSRAN